MSDDHRAAVREYLEKVVARLYPPSEVIARMIGGGSALAEMAEHITGLRASADALLKLSVVPPDFRLGKYWTAKGLAFEADKLADRGEVQRVAADFSDAVADMSASILRQQQELAELRSALSVAIRALDAIKIEDSKVKLQLGSGKQIEVVSGLTVHKAVLSRDDQDAIRKVAA